MSQFEGFKPTRKGIKALLKFPGVKADITNRTNRVAAAARALYESQEQDVRVVADVTNGKVRVGGTILGIHPEAVQIEADARVLGSAIDAAKGSLCRFLMLCQY